MHNAAYMEALERQLELLREYGNAAAGKPSSIAVGMLGGDAITKAAMGVGSSVSGVAQYVGSRSFIHGARYGFADRNFTEDDGRAVCGHLADNLKRAQPIYVAADIADMLHEAIDTLPLSIPLHEDDLPAPCGFALLGNRAWDMPTRPETGLFHRCRAISWVAQPKGVEIYLFGSTIVGGREGHSFEFLSFVDFPYNYSIDDPEFTARMEKHLRNLAGAEEFRITEFGDRGQTINATIPILSDTTYRYRNDVAARTFAYSVWSFMSQRCVTRTRRPLDRAGRRRYEAFEGYVEWTEPPSIEVVMLRAPERKETVETDERPGRDYSCRWFVRGHWRNQWYASEQRHKPKWIETYIAGPADMPIKGSTKIFAVVR